MSLQKRKLRQLPAYYQRTSTSPATRPAKYRGLAYCGIASLTLIALCLPIWVDAHETPDTDTVVIHTTPTGYTPSSLTVPANTTIVFENVSDTDVWPASNIHPTHEIYSAFDPRTPVNPGQSWSFTFTKPGTWTYHDHLYPQVTGTITVTEAKAVGIIPPWLTDVANTFLASFRAPEPLPYHLDSTISQEAEDLYSNENSLYSYIHVFGVPQTLQRLHVLSATQGSCHDAAHRAGRIAYELSDDQAFTQCSAECHSGCYHGAAELFFRDHGTANLATNLSTLCHTDLNPFISHQCLHGIGHGLMAWANYEIHEALQACDLLPQGRESCYTGVFMENIVGSLGEEAGHSTKYLSDDPHYPCPVVAERYKSACYFYQSSRMLQLLGSDWSALAATCAAAPPRFHQHCFESLGRDVGGIFSNDTLGAITACSVIQDNSNRLHCLNGAVQNYFWEPSGAPAALSFCAALTVETEKEACYTVIAQRATLVLPTLTDKARFCYGVEAPWQRACVAIVYP